MQVHRFPGAVYKSFLTRREADDWIARQEAVYNGRSSSHESKNQEAQPVARPSGEFGDDFIRLEPGEPEDLLTTGDAISRRTSSIAKRLAVLNPSYLQRQQSLEPCLVTTMFRCLLNNSPF